VAVVLIRTRQHIKVVVLGISRPADVPSISARRLREQQRHARLNVVRSARFPPARLEVPFPRYTRLACELTELEERNRAKFLAARSRLVQLLDLGRIEVAPEDMNIDISILVTHELRHIRKAAREVRLRREQLEKVIGTNDDLRLNDQR